MRMRATMATLTGVAPHVGAWIEIIRLRIYYLVLTVAPHVGAWIEITIKYGCGHVINSRTSRRCVD